MPARKGKESKPAAADEREWRDWWELRNELGRRLGKRDATGDIDPSLLREGRPEPERRARRR